MRWGILVLLLVLASPATWATTPDPLNPVPVPGASFQTDLGTFLKEEDAERFGEQFGSFVVSGGVGATAAGLTHTPTATIAYPGGWRTTETAAITYANNATCWVIVHHQTSGDLTTNVVFTRVPASHYLTNCTTSTQPTLPASSAWLMKVVTSGGSITTVTDLRARSPTATQRPAGCLDWKLDCGAVGDGVADDTTVLLGCLDRFTNRRGCWSIPAGTYKTTQPLSFPSVASPSAGGILQGAGMQNTTISYTGADVALRFTGAGGDNRGFALRDFTVQTNSPALGAIELVDSTNHFTFENLRLNGYSAVAGEGLRMIGQTTCNCLHQVTNLQIRLFNVAVRLSGFANNNTFTGVNCNNATTCFSFNAVAPDTTGGDDNLFLDSTCQGAGVTTCVDLQSGVTDRNTFVGLVADGPATGWVSTSGHIGTKCLGCQFSGTVTTGSGLANLWGAGTYALLATVTGLHNGMLFWCTDCRVALRCAAGGTGAWMKRINGAWVCDGDGREGSMPFNSGDATPSIANGAMWRTVNAAPTTITNFTNGVEGQLLSVRIADVNTTVDFSANANLKGNNGVDWIAAVDDVLSCAYHSTVWYCVPSRPTYGVVTGAQAFRLYVLQSVTVDLTTIGANSAVDRVLTFAASTFSTGGPAFCSPELAGIETGLVWSAWVTAANQVTLRIANVTAGGIDPVSRIWRCTQFNE